MIVDRPRAGRQDLANFSIPLTLDYPVQDLALPGCDANLLQLLRRWNRLASHSLESGERLGISVSQCDLRSH